MNELIEYENLPIVATGPFGEISQQVFDEVIDMTRPKTVINKSMKWVEFWRIVS